MGPLSGLINITEEICIVCYRSVVNRIYEYMTIKTNALLFLRTSHRK
jgi:hypothetical protein